MKRFRWHGHRVLALALARLVALTAVVASAAAAGGTQPAPLPEAAQTAEARRKVDQLYVARFAAGNAWEQRTLLRTMTDLAVRGEAAPPESLALLEAVRDWSAGAPDADWAFAATSQIAGRWQLEEMELRLDLCRRLVRSASEPAHYRALVPHMLETGWLLVVRDDFERAIPLLTQAAALARRVRDDRELASRSTAVLRDARDIAAAHEVAAQSLDRIARGEGDAGDHVAAGRYRCFFKGEWSAGLVLLGESDDEELASLAADDLASPTQADERLALAERWLTLAGRQSDRIVRQNMQRRGAYWLAGAAQAAGSLDRLALMDRLKKEREAIGQNTPPRAPRPKSRFAPNPLWYDWIVLTRDEAAIRRHFSSSADWSFDTDTGQLTLEGTGVLGGFSYPSTWGVIQFVFEVEPLATVKLRANGAEVALPINRAGEIHIELRHDSDRMRGRSIAPVLLWNTSSSMPAAPEGLEIVFITDSDVRLRLREVRFLPG